MTPTAHNELENQISNVLPEHDVAAHDGCGNRDRNDYQRFLSEYGISEEHVRAVTYSGERHYLPMDDIEIRESAIQGYGLFAKRLFRAGEIIAPALTDGCKTEAGRYTNHAAIPNARMVVRDDTNIDLVAIREINNEEITTDYRETLKARAVGYG